MAAIPEYEVYALKYAERDAQRADNFVGGDPHDGMTFDDRVVFHDGDDELAPGVSVHHIGGHTLGLQAVRVYTRRGWVVLASDASHYYEHFERNTCFPTTHHLGQVLEGYAKLRRLADSPAHIVPGHDPLVMKSYPAVTTELEGIAVRLDADPLQVIE